MRGQHGCSSLCRIWANGFLQKIGKWFMKWYEVSLDAGHFYAYDHKNYFNI